MFPRHAHCRSVIVRVKNRKYMDIKPGGCPNWREHHQIRRFLMSLSGWGYILNGQAVLIIVNKSDPCQSRIITEKT